MTRIYYPTWTERVPSAVPLCVDCANYRHTTHGARCAKFVIETRDENPVNGARLTFMLEECRELRADGGKCGPSGSRWEKRPAPPPDVPQKRWRWWPN